MALFSLPTKLKNNPFCPLCRPNKPAVRYNKSLPAQFFLETPTWHQVFEATKSVMFEQNSPFSPHLNVVNCSCAGAIPPSPLKSIGVPACRLPLRYTQYRPATGERAGLAATSSLLYLYLPGCHLSRRAILSLSSHHIESHPSSGSSLAGQFLTSLSLSLRVSPMYYMPPFLWSATALGPRQKGCGTVLVNEKHDTARGDQKYKYSSIRPRSQPLHKLLEVY